MEKGDNVLFNFREFEQMIKGALTKSGYKPPVKKRERAIIEEELTMSMAERELSMACQSDLQLYIKNYMEFLDIFKDADELNDLSLKIL